ncbi:phage tail protein [Clostridium saudiense]|uniref:phage tail protein n=2 Tax=Clostridium saudiense TaxID=1414720 RepID=UPI0018AA7254|nr:phage tail protein [Clostridium saudiense]
MIQIDRLIIFNKNASKNDLINNINPIATIDNITTNAIINYSIDSKHIITVNIDQCFDEEIINEISKYDKVIIKALSLENNYEYFMCSGSNNDIDNSYELIGLQLTIEWMSNMFIIDAKPRGLNSNLMLKHLREATEEYKQGKQFARDLDVTGDIDTIKNCNVWHDNFNNVLSDLQELYGSEVRRKGFGVALLYKTGRYENPVYEVNYAENLLSCNIERDFNNIVYGILPKGYNDLYGDIQYSEKITAGITIEKEYNIRVRETDTEKEDENYVYFNSKDEAIAELNRLAKAEFELNKVDEFKVTYDINYLDLCTVDDNVEKTYLQVGDLVRTNIPKLALSVDTRVISFNYNLLTEEIEDVTLSNADIGSLKVPTLNSVSKEVENKPSREEVTSTTRKEISDFINAGFGGYVMIYKDEIYIMDSPKKENAVKCLRINMNGIAGSTTGWQGPYNVAITVDGQIIADRMTTGILKSLNGESWFNLDNGDAQITGELRSVNGDEWVGLNAGGLTFQDWHKQEQVLRVASANFTNRDMNGVVFAMPKYSDFIGFSYIDKEDLSNGWTTSDTQYNFLEMWSSDQLVDGFQKNKGISFYARAFFNGGIRVKSASDNSYATITGTSTYNNGTGITKKLLGLYGDNGVILGYKNADSLTARLIVSEECFAGTGDTITSFGNWNFQAYTLHNVKLANYTLANTYVNLETKSIAEVSALETNSTDNVRYVYKDITSKDNKIVLNIPNEYLGRDYDIVGVAKFGFGDYAITSKEENRFIIETDREMTMNIEISIE